MTLPYFHVCFQSWYCWQLGIHLDPRYPYVDIHFPCGWLSMGWGRGRQGIRIETLARWRQRIRAHNARVAAEASMDEQIDGCEYDRDGAIVFTSPYGDDWRFETMVLGWFDEPRTSRMDNVGRRVLEQRRGLFTRLARS
ncbi:MAG: hypothetical protein PVSMB7_23380 [Chloroflexota bacterium]